MELKVVALALAAHLGVAAGKATRVDLSDIKAKEFCRCVPTNLAGSPTAAPYSLQAPRTVVVAS